MQKPIEINLVDGSQQVSYQELAALPPPVSYTEKTFPISHEYLLGKVLNSASDEGFRLKDSLYSVSHSTNRFFGVLEFVTEERHVHVGAILAVSNANDGTEGVSMWAGIRLNESNTVAFNEELVLAKRHSEDAMLQLGAQVAAGLQKMHEHWNINFERVEHYAEQSLTIEAAHHLICTAIREEVVAGREINAVLSLYHKARGNGKGYWSLFQSIVQVLNKLKVPQMIERTIQLHNLFDHFTGFKKRPSPYRQTRFA